MTIEVPGYTILRELGRGGMATVYLAVQDSLNRQVALKVIADHLATRPNYRERFLREGRIAASFHHRHIVAIHDVGTRGDVVYMAMEFLPRGSASSEAGRLSSADALRLVREIAGALDYAHGRGIVHRDVKPENILCHEDGAWLLSDFGVAHSEEIPSIVTREGVTVGTPHYMSPEQWRSRTPDGRADLYSLGVVLYQMLAGHVPYGGDDPWAIGMQHISAPVPLLPEPYTQLQGLLELLMAKDVDRRVASGAEVVQRVQQLERGQPLTAPVAPLPVQAVAPPTAVRRRWPALAAAAVAATALAALGGYRVMQPARERIEAPAHTTNAVAVLPFRALDGGADATYFADGLADELITSLASIDGLAVAARSSSFALRGTEHDPTTIGRMLGVGYVLEASVRRNAERVHIGARLVDTTRGFNVWAENYERSPGEVFGVQAEIAAAVAAKMTGREVPRVESPLAPPSHELGAFDEYVRGRALIDAGKPADALAAFRSALAADPAYARAQAGICHAEVRLYIERIDATARSRAESSCARARSMDDALREVDLALGELARAEGRYDDALSAYDRAGDDRTIAPDALTGRAMVYAERGNVDEARRYFAEAVALQPGYWRILMRSGNFELGLGQHPQAIALYERALELPGVPRARLLTNIGNSYMLAGDFEHAADRFEAALAADESRLALSNLGTILFYLERFVEAADKFRRAVEMAPDDYVMWGNLADALAAQAGQQSGASAAYEQALDRSRAFLAANPNDAAGLASVAWYSTNLGRTTEAERALARALELGGDTAEVVFIAALVHGRLGDDGAARRGLARAAELGYPHRVVKSAARLYRLGDAALVSLGKP